MVRDPMYVFRCSFISLNTWIGSNKVVEAALLRLVYVVCSSHSSQYLSSFVDVYSYLAVVGKPSVILQQLRIVKHDCLCSVHRQTQSRAVDVGSFALMKRTYENCCVRPSAGLSLCT
jgi:hypothetical protein